MVPAIPADIGARQHGAGQPLSYGRSPMSLAKRARDSLQVAASLVGALLVWEVVVRLLQVPEYILPPPSRVLADLARNAYIVGPAALYTLQPMVLGFAVAAVLGVAMALLVVYSRAFEAVFYPLLVV